MQLKTSIRLYSNALRSISVQRLIKARRALIEGLFCLLACLLMVSCSTDERDLQRTAGNDDTAYFMVTHGNTRLSNFWRSVFEPTKATADQLNVGLVSFYPAISSNGPVLNNLMAQALNGRPPGIIGTVWGDGMAPIIEQANAQGIPVAAINVYPDPEFYAPDASAPVLLYVGQNDYLAGIDVAYGLICASANLNYNGVDCQGSSLQQVFDAFIGNTQVSVVCTVHEQTPALFFRCDAFEQTMVNEFGLPASRFQRLVWDDAVPNSSSETLTAFFNAAELDSFDLILVMFTGSTPSQVFNNISVPPEILAKSRIGAFDTPSQACESLADGRINFLSDQGASLQGAKALEYLHFYVQTGQLPPFGQAPDGSVDNAWRESPDGFPWYKTGPQLIYQQCP